MVQEVAVKKPRLGCGKSLIRRVELQKSLPTGVLAANDPVLRWAFINGWIT